MLLKTLLIIVLAAFSGEADYYPPEYGDPMCADLDPGDLARFCPEDLAGKDGLPGWEVIVKISLVHEYLAEVECKATFHQGGVPEPVDVPPPTAGPWWTLDFPHTIPVDQHKVFSREELWSCDSDDLAWKKDSFIRADECETSTAPGYNMVVIAVRDEDGTRTVLEEYLDCDLEFTNGITDYHLKKQLNWPSKSGWTTGSISISTRSRAPTCVIEASRDMTLSSGLMIDEEVWQREKTLTSGGKLDRIASSSRHRIWSSTGTYKVVYDNKESGILEYATYHPDGANPGQRYLAKMAATLELLGENGALEYKWESREDAIEDKASKGAEIYHLGRRQVQMNSFDYQDPDLAFSRSTNYEVHNSSGAYLWEAGRPLTLFGASSDANILAIWSANADGNWVTGVDCADLYQAVEILSGQESTLSPDGAEHYPTEGCQGEPW